MSLLFGVVVQDADTGQFLCPLDGDVGYTKFINQAGKFDDIESAVLTASDFIEPHHIIIFPFYYVEK
jgi:hypothetical protein